METIYSETTVVSYLVANPHLLAKLRTFMAARGLVLPEICTPIEIVGE